jgi:nucleoside-diphosphate-sugar epimerase
MELMVGDICDPDAVDRATRGADRVIALAALVGDPACSLDEDLTMLVNYESTLRLIDACQKNRVGRLVFASSCSTYGANGDDLIFEESPLNPVSLYAHTRILSEDALLGGPKELEPVILRLSTVCGASRRMRFDLMVNTMTGFAIRNRKIQVTGANQWRPHLHVQDAAQAFVDAVEAPPCAAGRIYNVGHEDNNLTIGQVAERVQQHIRGVAVEHRGDNSDLRSYRVSFDRIQRELGFRPRFSVDHAIREVADLLGIREEIDFQDPEFHNVKSLEQKQLRVASEGQRAQAR